MSRLLFLVLIPFMFIGCDTPESLEPTNDKFFVKLIGGDGFQYGTDVIQTSDGGYAIAGYSETSIGAESQFLVCKTDRNGNVEWINRSFQQGRAVSIVEYSGSLIVGGTQGSGNNRRSVVRELNLNGAVNPDKIHVVETIDPDNQDSTFNVLSKITLGQDKLLICGNTLQRTNPDEDPDENVNIYLAALDYNSFIPDTVNNEPNKVAGKDFEIVYTVGVVENLNPAASYRYLLITSLATITDRDFEYQLWGLNEDLSLVIESGLPLGPQGLVSNFTVYENDVFLIGTSSNPIFTPDASVPPRAFMHNFSLLDPIPVLDKTYPIPTISDAYGQGVAISPDYLVYTLDEGNIDPSDPQNRTTSITLAGMDSFREPQWLHEFGVPGRNFAGNVIIDDQGNIVMVGTNDLESQTKVMLIKTGPNGEMTIK